jgi:hypothetical protein
MPSRTVVGYNGRGWKEQQCIEGGVQAEVEGAVGGGQGGDRCNG